jgi:hypothetical protein
MSARRSTALAFVLVISGVAFYSIRGVRSKAPEQWKTGYWIWAGEAPASSGFRPELLYVEAPGRHWPRDLPAADQYIVVRRIEPRSGLTDGAASSLAEDYKALVADAGGRAHITGLQIDYDCPTNKLESYGLFLKGVRRHLPASNRLSITALLDWFRPQTAVRYTLKQVDEFVPQFYDSGRVRESAGIAEPIDALKWAPIFNAYEVPYRIGISSFGRIARRRSDSSGHIEVNFFRDARPLDFAGRRPFARTTSVTAAGEYVVHYEVAAAPPAKLELLPGDTVDITFPTEASVLRAYEAARRFGGYSAGVIFFRWPNLYETLSLMPDDVQRIISGEPETAEIALEVRSPSCIERQCSDLYLDMGRSVQEADRTIGIRATAPLELFFPAEPLHPLPSRPNEIRVQIPAYSGLGRVYLGRTISSQPVQFEVVQQ